MSFELDDAGARDIDEQAARNGVPLGSVPERSPFAGTPKEVGLGLARIGGRASAVVGEGLSPLFRAFVARPVDNLFGTKLEDWWQDERRKRFDTLEHWKPDPTTTGVAAQVLGGLVDVGGSAIVFGPAATAGMVGIAKREEDIRRGLDPTTATATGAIEAAGTYAGLRIPLTLGQAAVGGGPMGAVRNFSYGAAVSVETGAAQRTAMKTVLEQAGYGRQAAAIDPFDTTTMTADALLGGLFSAGGHLAQMRATAKGQNAIDAALATTQARHAAVDVAPGLAADARSEAGHAKALDDAARALMRNEPVNVGTALENTTFVKRADPGRQDAIEEALAHTRDLTAPIDIGPVKTEADMRRVVKLSPEEQSRSDRFEASEGNLRELRAEIAKTKDPANREALQAELAKQEQAASKFATEPVESARTTARADESPRSAGEPFRDEPTLLSSARPALEAGAGTPPVRSLGDFFASSEEVRTRIEPTFEIPPEGMSNRSTFAPRGVDIFPLDGTRPPREAVAAAVANEQPTVRAAVEAAIERPDMMVALDDGVQLPAREVVQRAYQQREVAQRESRAFEAAVNCLLRTA